MKKIFIDGSAGTTGLRIFETSFRPAPTSRSSLCRRRSARIPLPRARALNTADIAILCLPDAAAREAVSLIENPDTVVLDTSTAHRTAPGWVYGFPELSPEREAEVRASKRIAVPGCHASGFCALVAPLTQTGIIKRMRTCRRFR